MKKWILLFCSAYMFATDTNLLQQEPFAKLETALYEVPAPESCLDISEIQRPKHLDEGILRHNLVPPQIESVYSFAKCSQAKRALELNDAQLASTIISEDEVFENLSTAPSETVNILFDICCVAHDLDGLSRLFHAVSNRTDFSLSRVQIEQIAWTIIQTNCRSYHPKIRFDALMAAALSQDAKAVPLICTLMDDPHEYVAAIACEIACFYHDEQIQQKAKQLLRSSLPTKKRAAAKILSSHKAFDLASLLKPLLKDETLSEEDRLDIASSLVDGIEEISFEELTQYIHDDRPSFRVLAVSYAIYHPNQETLTAILPLVDDANTFVQKNALVALGLWQHLLPEDVYENLDWIDSLLSSSNISLASNVAFYLLLSKNAYAQETASTWFYKTITTRNSEDQLIATSRLIRSGKNGLLLQKKLLDNPSVDSIPKLNIAKSLLENGEECSTASSFIKNFPTKQLLSEDSEAIFSWIGKTTIDHDLLNPRLPESSDLLIRLELLSCRAYANCPIEQEEIERILHERSWGICASAIGFMFSEIDSSLETIIEPLLNNAHEEVRIQAAYLYAMLCKSEKAAAYITKEYEHCSKEGKEMLLSAYGIIPIRYTETVLSPLLFDSSLTLRTKAAGAIVSSIYR